MSNPFSLSIARGTNFCDRDQEREDLLRHARNGNNVLLFSPRRYGKTSLVHEVQERLVHEGLLTIYADFFPIVSAQDLVSRFSLSLLKGIGRGLDDRTLAERLKDLFKRLIPTIEVKPDGYSLAIRFDQASESGPLLEDLLEGLHRYVKKRDLRACVALDEFQEVTELPDSKRIEGILRSQIQMHREISYFYVGSRRRTLQEMFTDKSRAFYKSAFPYPLKEIPEGDFAEHIHSLFSEGGKNCPISLAEEIYRLVRGYPYYVQKLASIAWDLSEKMCDSQVVRSAYSVLVHMEVPDFEATWSALTLIQRQVLKGLALESGALPYSREFLARYNLTIGGTQRAVRALADMDLIEKDGGKYRLTDPVMNAWLV